MNAALSNPPPWSLTGSIGTAWLLKENAPRPARAHHHAVKTLLFEVPLRNAHETSLAPGQDPEKEDE